MTRNKIYKAILIMLLILQTYFMDLVPGLNPLLTTFNTEFSKKIQLFLLIIALLISLIPNTKHNRPPLLSLGHFKFPVVFLILGCFAIVVASANIYGQSLRIGFQEYYGYFIIIGYFSFLVFFQMTENVVWFIRMARTFGCIYLSLQIFQGVVYFFSRKILLFYTTPALSILTNSGRFLEGSEFITFLALIISISPLLAKRRWTPSELVIVAEIVLFHALFNQGRMYLLISVGSFAISLFFQIYSKNLKQVWFLVAPPVLCILIVFFGMMINQMNFTSGSRINSYLARTASFSYFYKHFFYNRWFGIGFPNSGNYSWLLKGTRGIDDNGGLMTYQDVGIVGTVGILGIVGAIFALIILWKILHCLVVSKQKPVIMIMIYYILASSITLSPLDISRMWIFTLILLLCDWCWRGASGGKSCSFDVHL